MRANRMELVEKCSVSRINCKLHYFIKLKDYLYLNVTSVYPTPVCCTIHLSAIHDSLSCIWTHAIDHLPYPNTLAHDLHLIKSHTNIHQENKKIKIDREKKPKSSNSQTLFSNKRKYSLMRKVLNYSRFIKEVEKKCQPITFSIP